MKYIFNELVAIATVLGNIAIIVGLIVAAFVSIHDGAVISAIGLGQYMINVIYRNRRFLFEEGF